MKKITRSLFLINSFIFGVYSLFFLTDIPIKLLSDNIILNPKTYYIKNLVGFGFGILFFITFIIFLLLKKNIITRGNTINKVLKEIDHYLLVSNFLIITWVCFRFVFTRGYSFDPAYPLFGHIYLQQISIITIGSLIAGFFLIFIINRLIIKYKSGENIKSKFLIVVFLGTFILSILLGINDNGSKGLTSQFNRLQMHYPHDTKIISHMGLLNFIKNFNKIYSKQKKEIEQLGRKGKVFELSFHTLTHPIGASLFYYPIYYVFGYNIFWFCIFSILIGSLSVFPLFFLLKNILGEDAAYYGTPILIFIPSYLLFNATSFEVVNLFFCLLSIIAFYNAVANGKKISLIGSSLLIFIYLITHFHALTIILLYAVMPIAFSKKLKTNIPLINALMICFFVFVLFFLSEVFLGYSYIKNFFDAFLLLSTTDAVPSFFHHLHYIARKILVFSIFIGVPMLAYLFLFKALRFELAKNLLLKYQSIATMAIIMVLTFSNNMGQGENERAWVYIVPFLIFPLVSVIVRMINNLQYSGFYYVFLGFSFFQAWVLQMVVNTAW